MAVPHTFGGPSSKDPDKARQHQPTKGDWRPSFYPAEAYAPYQNTNCQSPKDHEEADLCQQWRMAEATEKAVALADAQYWWNIAQAVSTVLAAVATAFAAIAAAAAAKSANASVSVAQDTAIRELRAYVSAFPDFIHSFGVGTFPAARFKIRNTGVTPAHRLNHRAEVLVLPEPLPVGYRFPRLTTRTTSPIVAFPNLPMDGVVVSSVAVTKADIDGIMAGTARIYIFGQVFYDDGFAPEERVTEYCAFVSANRDTLQKLTRNYGPDDLKISFTAAPEGNCAT